MVVAVFTENDFSVKTMQSIAGVGIGVANQYHEDAFPVEPGFFAGSGWESPPVSSRPVIGRGGLDDLGWMLIAGFTAALPDTGYEYDQGSEGADDNRINERFQLRPRLLHARVRQSWRRSGR